MNERLKMLRKALNKNLVEFGENIHLSKTQISKMETGAANLTDRTIDAICSFYNVNETWLRTGEGEMFQQLTRDEELARHLGELLKGEPESFRKRLIASLIKIPEGDPFWFTLEQVLDEIKK